MRLSIDSKLGRQATKTVTIHKIKRVFFANYCVHEFHGLTPILGTTNLCEGILRRILANLTIE